MGKTSCDLRARSTAVVLAAAAVVLVASAIAASAATTTVPPELVAAWTRNVTKADVKRFVPGETRDSPTGVWTMTITTKGQIGFYEPNNYFPTCKICAPGLWSDLLVTGARLTILPKLQGHWAAECRKRPRGVYRWKVSGSALALKVVNEKCGYLKALLIGTWKRT